MPREDYIKKQADQLARVLGKVIFNLLGVKTGELPQPEEPVMDMLSKGLDEDFDVIWNAGADGMLERLKMSRRWNNDNLDQLGKVLFEIATDPLAPAEQDGNDLLKKALRILEFVNERSKTWSMERQQLIGRIRELPGTS